MAAGVFYDPTCAVMSRKVARGQASRAILFYAAPAHERSQQRRDESKKCPSSANAWTLFQIRCPLLHSMPTIVRPPKCDQLQRRKVCFWRAWMFVSFRGMPDDCGQCRVGHGIHNGRTITHRAESSLLY